MDHQSAGLSGQTGLVVTYSLIEQYRYGRGDVCYGGDHARAFDVCFDAGRAGDADSDGEDAAQPSVRLG
jgi:hypothetical protein